MRILRWIPLLIAVVAIYLLAIHAKDVKTDKLLAQAPKHLGISDKDWKRWSRLSDQIESGHIPDLTESDWDALKKLCSSANATFRGQNIELLGFLKDTPYRAQAIKLSERATKDANEFVRFSGLQNLKQLGSSDWLKKAKEMASDPSKAVREAAKKLASEAN